MRIGEIKAKAWAKLSGNWGRFALYTLVFSVLSGLCSQHISYRGSVEPGPEVFRLLASPSALWIVPGYCICRLLGALLYYGYLDIFIKTRAGMPAGTKNIFMQFALNPAKIIVATLITLALEGTYVLICSLLLLWPYLQLAAIVLGIIYFLLGMRLSMVPLILLENPYTTVSAAFVQSFYVTRGCLWRMIVLALSFIGWLLLCVLTVGVLYFWVAPYICMTQVYFYYTIKAEKLGSRTA